MDTARRTVVVVAAVVALAVSTVGSGAFGGTPIADAAGGALSASATRVAPGTGAFSIWPVVYLGLLALAVVQALPSRARSARHRATGWWVAASAVLNAVWVLVVQAGWLWVSVAVIAALVAVLCVVAVRLARTPADGAAEAVLVDGTVGLYLGWVCVATIANAAAALADADVGGLGLGATTWSVVLLVVAALLALALVSRLRTDLGLCVGVALAVAWGIAWIGVGRTVDPVDDVVAVVAWVAAAVVVVGTCVLLARPGTRGRTRPGVGGAPARA
ncbi:tryptophan-rich sensory protein [Luteimicrobium subarcticum]|uniref:TspO/MBR related protein n=1 Tax=Luteimicrobium subarcticum TaxID=620910 RepID=A0A2M8WTL7_9MICO|nr:tryptophan-rich sensory protein [Luteimicrobium subarcticum]PJI94206.1 TspO/MBR related protein [Luteimicrobium subarcticum]